MNPGIGYRAFSAPRTVGMQDSANGFRRITLLRTPVNRGEEEGSERGGSEHHKRLRHQREGAEERGGVLSEDATPFWFGYSAVASLGAFEE